MTRRLAIAVAFTAACLTAPGSWPIPGPAALRAQQLQATSIIDDVRALEARRAAQQAALGTGPGVTQADYLRIDNEYISKARALEPKRTAAIDALQRQSGVGNLGQGAGGTAPTAGRGLAGDIDSRPLSGREYDRVMRAAKQMGYKIPPPQGDAFTIKELNVTFHREPSPFASAPGSSTREAEIAQGSNKETDLNFGKKPGGARPTARPNTNVATMQNLAKGGSALGKLPQQLLRSPADLQELGKMTMRNLEAAGINNPQLQDQVTMLKNGLSPEAAGIVPAGGTPAEKAKAMARFQSQVRDVTTQAVRATQAAADSTMAGLRDAARNAEAAAAQARQSGNADAIARTRQNLYNAKVEMLDFGAQQRAARQLLIKNSPAGMQLLAQAQGLDARLVSTPNGPRWQTPDGLKTQSQMVDALSKPPTPAAGTAGLGRRLLGVGLLGLMVHGGYAGLKQAATDAGEEAAKSGDGALTSTLKTGIYTVWHGLGFGAAKAIGTQAGQESAAQYAEDVKAGTVDPESRLSAAWARVRGIGWGVAKFTGLQDIKDAAGRLTDAPGWAQARYEQAQAEKRLAEQLADAERRNAERAARGSKPAGAEPAKPGGRTQPQPAPDPTPSATRPPATGGAGKPAPKPPDKPEAKTDVMPNLVRTEWRGDAVFKMGDSTQALALQVSIDSYNKISGTLKWIVWFDESDPPTLRDVPLTGVYDSKAGRFSITIDKLFSKETTITNTFTVPLPGGGTGQERVQVVERKEDGVRGRIDGTIDSADAAHGSITITHSSAIIVDGKEQGRGTDPLGGTWTLVRRK